MDLNYNRHLSKLNLPKTGESYTGKLANVTGYGFSMMKVVNGIEEGNSDYKLKYAEAKVLSNKQCQLDFLLDFAFMFIRSYQICA